MWRKTKFKFRLQACEKITSDLDSVKDFPKVLQFAPQSITALQQSNLNMEEKCR